MTSKLYITRRTTPRVLWASLVSIFAERQDMLRKSTTKSNQDGQGIKETALWNQIKETKIAWWFNWDIQDTGKERIDFKKFFELADATSWLRGHSLKKYKPRCHTRLRQNFSIRVINEWNKLPQSVIEAPSVNAFKNRLDKYWSDMGDYSWHGYTTYQPQVQLHVI